MWLNKLKHNKMQFFLVGIMLIAIAIVFSSCICFTLELKTYANNRFSKDYCPDAYVYSVNNAEPKDNFPNASLWSNIRDVSALKGKCISVPVKHNDVNISSTTNMLCTLKDDKFRKYMKIVKGDVNSDEPGDGEIWIVKTLASSYGIKVGDKLTVTYKKPIELTVTAIYTATFAPSERLTIYANIVNSGTLAAFKDEADAGVLALDLYDSSQSSVDKLAMNDSYSLMTFSRDKLRRYSTDISGIVGWVSAIAALVVFLAALFIIRFIINNNIRKELRSIGIYKCLGYTSKKIMAFYIKAYMLVGGVAILIGTVVALSLAYYLGASASEALGGFRLTGTSVAVCAGAIVLLILLLWGDAMLTLRKVKGITPVEAISAGQALGEKKLTHSVIRNASTPFAMAINEIFKHKKTSIITFLVLTVSVYLILFFASSYYTCMNIYKRANVWIACPRFNAIVTGSVSEDVAKFIRNSGYAESAVLGNVYYYPPVSIPQYGGNARSIEFIVLDDSRMSTTGISMKEGKSPVRAEEIAVSQKLLQELHMQVGDYLHIGIGGVEKDFLIYGTFASMETYAIIMNTDGMKEINKSYTPGSCFVMLKDVMDFGAFKDYVQYHFKDVTVDREWTALKYAVAAIENMLTSVMRTMLIVFILFAVISIVNVLALTISSKKKQYGIMKSLGFTTGYMVKQNLFHILILFGTGTLLACALHLAFSKYLFGILVIDAMVDSGTLSSALMLGTALLIILVTLFLSLPIWKITPTDLMEGE